MQNVLLFTGLPSSVRNSEAIVNEFNSVTITWTYDKKKNDIAVTNYTITVSPVSGVGQKFSQIVEAGLIMQVEIELYLLSPDTNYVATIRAYNLLGASNGVNVFFSKFWI